MQTVAIIGTGLIGTSLALALKRRDPSLRVTGFDADAARAARALELGALDCCAASPRDLDGCSTIVLAVPVGAVREVLASLVPLAAGTVVTDVGSVKAAVVQDAQAALGEAAIHFVPGHPVAGTENSGPEAASGTLFDGCRVILTPGADTDRDAVGTVAALWRSAGADAVTEMDADEHDRIFACASHLPHLVAYALIGGLLSRADADTVFACSAGGLRDFTRVAASDPVLWRDIFLANAGPVVEALDDFSTGAGRLRECIARGDGEALCKLLGEAASRRRND